MVSRTRIRSAILQLAVAALIAGGAFGAERVEPKPRFRIEPAYTKQARKAKIQGLVALGCTIGKDGIPKDITVERSLDKGLDQNAVDALKKWIFWPATENGAAVEQHAVIDFSFQLSRRR